MIFIHWGTSMNIIQEWFTVMVRVGWDIKKKVCKPTKSGALSGWDVLSYWLGLVAGGLVPPTSSNWLIQSTFKIIYISTSNCEASYVSIFRCRWYQPSFSMSHSRTIPNLGRSRAVPLATSDCRRLGKRPLHKTRDLQPLVVWSNLVSLHGHTGKCSVPCGWRKVWEMA